MAGFESEAIKAHTPDIIATTDQSMRDAAWLAHALRTPRIYNAAHDSEKLGEDQYYAREVCAVLQYLVSGERNERTASDVLRTMANSKAQSMRMLIGQIIVSWDAVIPGLRARITEDHVLDQLTK